MDDFAFSTRSQWALLHKILLHKIYLSKLVISSDEELNQIVSYS
jgi:hypothetical protein